MGMHRFGFGKSNAMLCNSSHMPDLFSTHHGFGG